MCKKDREREGGQQRNGEVVGNVEGYGQSAVSLSLSPTLIGNLIISKEKKRERKRIERERGKNFHLEEREKRCPSEYRQVPERERERER